MYLSVFGEFILVVKFGDDSWYREDYIWSHYTFDKLVSGKVKYNNIQIPHSRLRYTRCLGMVILDILIDHYFASTIKLATCLF